MISTDEIINRNSGLIPDLQNSNNKNIGKSKCKKLNIDERFLSTKKTFDDFINEEFDFNSNFTSFGDMMEIIYNNIERKKFDESTKKTLNNFFKTYENNYIGFKTAQHYLGFDKTIISGVIYFVNFVDECKESLDYFFDYNDQDDDDQSIKNMFYCYLHGIIFTSFYYTFKTK